MTGGWAFSVQAPHPRRPPPPPSPTGSISDDDTVDPLWSDIPHHVIRTIHREQQQQQQQQQQPQHQQPTPLDDDINADTNDGAADDAILFSAVLPPTFAYPHWYEPHPLAVWASGQLQQQQLQQLNSTTPAILSSLTTNVGKMFGVLVVLSSSTSTSTDQETSTLPNRRLGYLTAYSGTIAGITDPTQYGFVPMVYDRFAPDKNDNDDDDNDSRFYARGEAQLNALNQQVAQLETSVERKQRKAHLEAVQQETNEALAKAKQWQKDEKEKRRQIRLNRTSGRGGNRNEDTVTQGQAQGPIGGVAESAL
eukprot:scaffold6480_cov165-Amphora_coffeaeformis.AAC.4